MTKKLFIGLFLVCFVLVPIVYLKADSGRESKYLPPQNIQIMYSTEDHISQAKSIAGNIINKIDQRGQNLFRPHTDVDMSGISTYTIDQDNGAIFWINDHESTLGTRVASGVSIMLPKITLAYDDYVCRIAKMPTPFSGTTKVVVSTVAWVSGTTDHIWNATTGVTNETAAKVAPEVSEMDAVGDWLEFKAVYGVTGSTWYQVGRYIQ